VLVIGRGSGIARAIVLAVSEAGGRVIAGGRHQENLAESYRGLDIGVELVDVTDESSVTALAGRLTRLDRVVSTASARAWGGCADLTAGLVGASFDTKVTGPLLLAKHLAGQLAPAGSFLFMSGATALKPAPGMLAVAATNAAVTPSPPGWPSNWPRSGSTPSPPGPSTPAPTTRSATSGRPRCSRPGPRPTRPGASAPPTTSRPRP